jgi:predicted DsbA family dithiol-disulfide isomerase
MDRAAYLRAKFGGDVAAGQIYRRIVEAARDDGIEFAFERMKRTPNTVLAQRLILFADQQGRAEELIRVLFRALFQEGRDVGRIDVLTEIAGEAGLDPAEAAAFLEGDRLAREVHEAQAQAQRMGVRGVPVFIVDHEHAVTGAQPPEILAGLLDVAAATRAGATVQ